MLNLDPGDLVTTYVSAILSAVLLRDSGEASKAMRLESLARAIARELQSRGESGAQALELLLRHHSPAVRERAQGDAHHP